MKQLNGQISLFDFMEQPKKVASIEDVGNIYLVL